MIDLTVVVKAPLDPVSISMGGDQAMISQILRYAGLTVSSQISRAAADHRAHMAYLSCDQ
ncbi:hypothetical protein D3C85_1636690 [compost metagenome]